MKMGVLQQNPHFVIAPAGSFCMLGMTGTFVKGTEADRSTLGEP